MAQMRLRAATPEERSMYLYACELGLNPPEIHAQSLHTVGQGGIDLGVVISFFSPIVDCSTCSSNIPSTTVIHGDL